MQAASTLHAATLQGGRVSIRGRLSTRGSPAGESLGGISELAAQAANAAAGRRAVRESHRRESESGANGSTALGSPRTLMLLQVHVVQRDDEVSAVALAGRRLAVGGRDRKLGMYDVADLQRSVEKAQQGAALSDGYERPVLLWEAQSEEFVNAVALSSEYVVYGGAAQTLTVLDAVSGHVLQQLPCNCVVWSCSILGGYVAYGGEGASLSVFNIREQREELVLPVDGVVYSTCLTKHSLCFANGSKVCVVGGGKGRCGWLDPLGSEMLDVMSAHVAEEVGKAPLPDQKADQGSPSSLFLQLPTQIKAARPSLPFLQLPAQIKAARSSFSRPFHAGEPEQRRAA